MCPFSISTTLPESDITSRNTTQETKPATSEDIAVSSTHGIEVPWVTSRLRLGSRAARTPSIGVGFSLSARSLRGSARPNP